MMIKTWHWALVAVGITLCILIVAIGLGGNSVENIYFIPVGTFSIFPAANSSDELGTTENASYAGDHPRSEQRTIDSYYTVEEQNITSLVSTNQKITILDITDTDIHEFSHLEKSLYEMNNSTASVNSGLQPGKSFAGNTSDYFRFINSVCKNKQRTECYADIPVFRYHERYYSISWFVYDTTRAI